MAKFEEQYIVDKKGRRTAVVLPVEDYDELLEDLHDLAVIAERSDEPATDFQELKTKLRRHGLLSDHCKSPCQGSCPEPRDRPATAPKPKGQPLCESVQSV